MDTGGLPFRTRAAAWIVTGPLGHLYGGGVDWAVFMVRLGWMRARGRRPGTLI